jgi:nucleotide-binding universal stress UspA family protein
MELRQILCPVDFSGLSAAALRYASLLARCGNARLVAAYAQSFSPPPYFTEGQVGELERQFHDAFQGAEAALRRFVDAELGTDAGPGTEVKVVEAMPVDGILRLSRDIKADLVVMGTHGRSGVNRLMLGSVAERVLRESEVPVLTVRGDTAAAVAPPKNILCPVNNTPAAREALSMAAHLARCFGGNIVAVHVKEGHAGHGIGDLCAWVPDEIRSHCTIRELTREGEAAEQIVALARETPCDLLVIGARHRRFFDSTVLGSTTARVVRHAPCPVLTVYAKTA